MACISVRLVHLPGLQFARPFPFAILRASESLWYRTVVCILKVYVTWLGTNDCGLAAFSVNSGCVLAIVFDCQALVENLQCIILAKVLRGYSFWKRRHHPGKGLYRLSEVRMCQVGRGAAGISH